jgi:KUP system potassium uptake protein
VVVFVCVKCLPVYTVPVEERVLVKRIGPDNFHMFRCVVRYGYKDVHKKDDDFETMLYNGIVRYVRCEGTMEYCGYSDSEECNAVTCSTESEILPVKKELAHRRGTLVIPPDQTSHSGVVTTHEIEFLNRCKDAGMVHMLGNTVVRARRDSNFMKKVAINYLYAFLRKVCRENSVILYLPHESLLNVGQICYV